MFVSCLVGGQNTVSWAGGKYSFLQFIFSLYRNSSELIDGEKGKKKKKKKKREKKLVTNKAHPGSGAKQISFKSGMPGLISHPTWRYNVILYHSQSQ